MTELKPLHPVPEAPRRSSVFRDFPKRAVFITHSDGMYLNTSAELHPFVQVVTIGPVRMTPRDIADELERESGKIYVIVDFYAMPPFDTDDPNVIQTVLERGFCSTILYHGRSDDPRKDWLIRKQRIWPSTAALPPST